MNLKGVKLRIQRLNRLARGLAKEVTLWKGGDDPLLYLERKAYLGAIQDAVAATETACGVLVKVCQRLENAVPSPPSR